MTRLIGRSLSPCKIAVEVGQVPACKEQRGVLGGPVGLEPVESVSSRRIVSGKDRRPREPW